MLGFAMKNSFNKLAFHGKMQLNSMETNGKLFYSFHLLFFKGKLNVHPEMKTNWR